MSLSIPRAAALPAGLVLAPVAAAGTSCCQNHVTGDSSREGGCEQAGSEQGSEDHRLEHHDHRM